MSYSHDIFISYRRNPETLVWIAEHFVPLLRLRVEMELGRRLEIFIDDQIEIGTSWPASLGSALGGSRILIALWTRTYLSSPWCAAELSHMMVREQKEKLRTGSRPHGIIIPAFIHDGERFPRELAHIQHFAMQECFNVRMARNSPRAEELDALLGAQAPAIAACINNAPAWRKSWPRSATKKIYDRLYQQLEPVQEVIPRFTSQ